MTHDLGSSVVSGSGYSRGGPRPGRTCLQFVVTEGLQWAVIGVGQLVVAFFCHRCLPPPHLCCLVILVYLMPSFVLLMPSACSTGKKVTSGEGMGWGTNTPATDGGFAFEALPPVSRPDRS